MCFSPSPLEPGPGLSLDDGLEEVLRRHVDLPVVLGRRELDEPLLARRQLALLVLRFTERWFPKMNGYWTHFDKKGVDGEDLVNFLQGDWRE